MVEHVDCQPDTKTKSFSQFLKLYILIYYIFQFKPKRSRIRRVISSLIQSVGVANFPIGRALTRVVH
jgi:hypothetical protein